MKISFGKKVLEVRPWGSKEDGKVLLMTRDQALKTEIIAQMYDTPDAFEYLAGEYSVEDMADLMMVVADGNRVGLFFNLDHMRPMLCVCVPDEPEEA